MPRGMYKSRRLRRVYRKTPGGVITLQYKLRKPRAAACNKCGEVLKGVPRERATKLKKMPKTMKRPERPYGGVMCSRCMRQLIKEEARKVSVDV